MSNATTEPVESTKPNPVIEGFKAEMEKNGSFTLPKGSIVYVSTQYRMASEITSQDPFDQYYKVGGEPITLNTIGEGQEVSLSDDQMCANLVASNNVHISCCPTSPEEVGLVKGYNELKKYVFGTSKEAFLQKEEMIKQKEKEIGEIRRKTAIEFLKKYDLMGDMKEEDIIDVYISMECKVEE